MAGTITGGKAAAEVNKRKYGADFYATIGRLGGSVSSTGGFASEEVGPDGLTGRERARLVGARGGRNGKRGKAKSV